MLRSFVRCFKEKLRGLLGDAGKFPEQAVQKFVGGCKIRDRKFPVEACSEASNAAKVVRKFPEEAVQTLLEETWKVGDWSFVEGAVQKDQKVLLEAWKLLGEAIHRGRG